MADRHVNDELLDLLTASGAREGAPSPVADFLQQLQSLGDSPPNDAVVTRHLAMLTDEAALVPVGAPAIRGSTGPLVRRRRFALRSLVSGFVLNALIGTAAFAAVGAGTAVAADGATPGDFLYGVDRALERVGVNNGGAEERLEEAMALVDRGQHGRAMETVEEAIEDLAKDPANATAVQALRSASEQIATVRTTEAPGYQDTQGFRDQVAGLLGVISTEMDNGTINGALIAQTATGFSETAREFAESLGGGPDGLPPDPDTPPGNSKSPGDKKPDALPGRPDTPGPPD